MLRLPLPAESELPSSSLASNGLFPVSSPVACLTTCHHGARISERGGAGGGFRTRVGGLSTNEGGCSERALCLGPLTLARSMNAGASRR